PRWSGIHPQAYVPPTARVGADVAIYPFAYVGDEAEVGDCATIHPGAGVGDRCRIARGAILHPDVGLYAGVILGVRRAVHAGPAWNVPAGQQVLGSAAIPIREQRRIFQMMARLPEMHRQVRELATQLALLTASLPQGTDVEEDPTGF